MDKVHSKPKNQDTWMLTVTAPISFRDDIEHFFIFKSGLVSNVFGLTPFCLLCPDVKNPHLTLSLNMG